MLSARSLVQHLVAATDAPEAQLIEMLVALHDGGLLPADPEAPLRISDLVTVALALISNVDPSRVAEQVTQLGDRFLTAGNVDRDEAGHYRWQPWPEWGESVRSMLTRAINHTRWHNDGVARQLRLLRRNLGDTITLEALTSEGHVGVYAIPKCIRQDALPASSTSVLTYAVENTLSWILITHLVAEALGPFPVHGNDNAHQPVEREPAAPRWN